LDPLLLSSGSFISPLRFKCDTHSYQILTVGRAHTAFPPHKRRPLLPPYQTFASRLAWSSSQPMMRRAPACD
jgi:hypothetical protein